jgi:CheY-like chemotaxis protein
VVLGEIVTAATEAIRPLFRTKGLYLTTEVPEELAVFCDRTRIREVLLNLLSNAGRFTERGGVRVQARVEGQEVVVSVADTGPGIAAEDQARLFQPFQQADGSIRRRFGGSGLGLSISKHFVDLHGGRMWLESPAPGSNLTPSAPPSLAGKEDGEIGPGTAIFFSLPFEPPAADGGAFTRWLSPEWEYRQRTRKWLAPTPDVRTRLVVVEEGTLLQRLLRRYLGDMEIAAAGSLEEAAQELAQRPVQALLINDLAVGPAIERIRQSDVLPYGTPALVCGLPGEEEAAHALGVDGYLVKPVAQEALLAVLDRLQVARGAVLIVDDELDAIQLFWRMLTASGRGYRVLTATNGEQALAILRNERPDVVLLDLVMPTMDGFQLLTKRSEEPAWRDVPVIVMSARDPADHPIMASAVGITRGGGLTVPQLLTYIEVVSGPLTRNGRPARPVPPEMSSG